MSKLLLTESITILRKELTDSETLDDFLAKRFRQCEFDFSDLRLKNDQNYPELSNEIVNELNSKFKGYVGGDVSESDIAIQLWSKIRMNRELASNNFYWTYLTLNYFLPSIIASVEIIEDEEKRKNEFESLVFNTSTSQGPVLKMPISGLWWATEITYNSSLSDTFYYTELFLRNRHLRFKNLGGHQIIRSPHVIEALLDFIYKNENQELNGELIGHEAISQASSKTLNQIGGLLLLSFLSKEEVYQKLEENKKLIFSRAYEIKIGKKKSRLLLQGKSIEHLYDSSNSYHDFEFNQSENEKSETFESEESSNNRSQENGNISIYFHLNKTSGQYLLEESKIEAGWDYAIGLNFNNSDEYLIHFYEEGKIKKTNYEELKEKTIGKTYSNGKNRKLTLIGVTKVSSPVLFGLAYRKSGKVYFKALDESDPEIFRMDNGSLMQEGKKVHYQQHDQILYKILPYSIIHDLGTLVQGPLGRGKDITNEYYENQWEILKEQWPELFEY